MTQYLYNPRLRYTDDLPLNPYLPLAFHRKLPGYEPTPLRKVPAIATHIDVGHLWIKDESHRFGLPSFKILGASWGTYCALDKLAGGLPPWETFEQLVDALNPFRPLVLIAATDGNHGRAVAYMARLLGLGAQIFVPSGTAAARVVGIEREGATCEIVDGTYDDAVARAAMEAGGNRILISDTSQSNDEDVPRRVIEGYSTIFSEMEEQLKDRCEPGPELVLIQVGVGALAAAAARHFRRASVRPKPILISVEPKKAAGIFTSMKKGQIVSVPGPHDSIMAGLNCGTPSIVAWPTVSRAYDAYMTIGDERAREGVRVLANEGIIAGETGAAGLGGLLEFLSGSGAAERRARFHLDESTRVMLLSTEGVTDPEMSEEILGDVPA